MAESQLHLDMKRWIAERYLKQGVKKEDIKFEKDFRKKQLKPGERLKYSRADVYIRNNGGTAIYCQCKLSNLWLINFVDKKIPIIKDYCSNIVVVIPYNLEMLEPVNFQTHYKELTRCGVDILISPHCKEIENRSKFQIFMSYKALEKLCKLRNRYNQQKPVVDFIEKDLEKLVKKSCNDR